jgi:coenzyme F420-reducing hydrogenase alpha subunit
VGGFTMLPEKFQLELLRRRLISSLEDLERTAELFLSFTIPDFSRETEFVALKGQNHYPFIGGDLISTDGVVKMEEQYREMTNEYMPDHSTSKWSRLSRQTMAVGALARINNNFTNLQPQARKLAESFGLVPVCHNPFMNNIAQLVECLHVVADSVKLVDRLLDSEWSDPRQEVIPRAGLGVAAVEVPRGILYHAYEFDENGRIVKADCVIPTSQNNGNIHHDIVELARQCAESGKTDREIQLLAEMLVRAYDPCISCSVH